jgi:nucleoside-diphosphate-sugar epimerase
MRILLTGASGFVGGAVLRALSQRGVETVALSRRAPTVAEDYVWRDVDLMQPPAVAAALNAIRPDAIIHLAWIVEHGAFWTSATNLDWITASCRLALSGRAAGVQRFVGVGTCFEYDCTASHICREDGTPLRPTLLYGVSKDAARRVLSALALSHDFEFAWARLFFLYGPGENPRRLVPSIARALAAGQLAECSAGRAVRDYMDVRDAAEALVALALSPITGAVNIGSGEGNSVRRIVQILGRVAGRSELLRVGALPDREGEPARIVADITRLRDEVGHRTGRPLEDGLAEAFVYWSEAARAAR